MKKQILLLSLLACGTKPASTTIDTTEGIDTVDTVFSKREVPEISDIPEIISTSPLEKCSTHIVNRDYHFAPLGTGDRKKICNLTGTDQRGDEFQLYDFLGEVTVLIISNSTCEECIAWFDNDGPYQVMRQYEGVRTVNVILRNEHYEWADADDIAQLHSKYNLSNYPLLAVTPDQIGYADDQFEPFRNDRFFPMFYIIDKRMKLAWASTPYNRWAEDFHANHEWRMTVTDLIQEP